MAVAGSFIVSLASMLQIVFIGLIIYEIIRLIGSFGRSKDGKAVGDGIVSAGKGVFDFFKERSEKKKAEAAQREKELEDENRRKEELGRYLGTLAIDERDKLKKLEQGIQMLNNVLEDEKRLLDPNVLDQMNSHVIEPMSRAVQKIRDDVSKEIKAGRTMRSQDQSTNLINDVEKDYDEMVTSVNTLQKKLGERLNKYNEKNSGASETDKAFVSENMELVQSYVTKLSKHNVKETCGKLKIVEKEYMDKFRKIQIALQRGIVSESNNLRTSMDKLSKSVVELKNSLNGDPMKRGKVITDFKSAVVELKKHVEPLSEGLNNLINSIGSFHEDTTNINSKTTQLKELINIINSDYDQLKNHPNMKGYFS